MRPDQAEDINLDDRYTAHAARHGVSAKELFEVWVNVETWVPNKKGRTADWLMVGRTDGGRPIVAAIVLDAERSEVRPITARLAEPWEIAKWLS